MRAMLTPSKLRLLGFAALAAVAVGALTPSFGEEAGSHEAQKIRQTWSFAGIAGHYDRAQLQRGFQIYKEVCSTCHGIKRIAFRNLADAGGPGFPLEAVKLLAESYKVEDGPNDDGKMFKRAGRLSDYIPSPFKNDQEARSVNNGALPPDLSLMARARNFEQEYPWYKHIFMMGKDVAQGYQEAGADYIYSLLTGYVDAPKTMKMSDGMYYNAGYPGHQIAMPPPLAGGDGVVKYTDKTPGTVDNYARDIAAFLSWTADPKLEERKQMGWVVLGFLSITALLLFFAKRRLWSDLH